jgi:hypothetical protein
MIEHGMTLWEINKTLQELLDRYDDAGPEESPAIEAEIIRYTGETLPDKVDSYRGVILRDLAIAEAARAESEKLANIAKTLKARADWLKNIALTCMEARSIAKLEGRTGGYLRVQANGGRANPVVVDPSLVPDRLCDAHITMSWDAWIELRIFAAQAPNAHIERKPRMEAIIAEAVQGRACPGAYMPERGVHLRVK